jgi:hypothetical protein
MAETADYSPGDWKGYDFKDAKKSYDAHVGRSYSDAAAKGTKAADLVATFTETQSEHPLIIACDVTGSMGNWPAVIFSKLPYLDIEGKEYLGDDMEISFAAIGDATSDQYPFQIRPFSKGTDLEKQLKGLVIEGGGGGTHSESYELAALYALQNIRTPKADKPILVIIGDEAMYNTISKAHAALVNATIEGSAMDTKDVFTALKEKFSVYGIRKRFEGRDEPTIQKQWEDLLGADHIASLQHPERVVDVIFGILARETGRVDYFKGEIEERQEADQVDTVYKSLATIHANLPPKVSPKGKGKSIMALPKGKKTKHLLGK